MRRRALQLVPLILLALVSISRGQQPAAEPLQVRILSYNIHHGEGIDRQLDLPRIAEVIRSAEPDLVALQEVDSRVERSAGVDQPAELSRLTKMEVVFGDNIVFQGGKYGNAVLSRWPILRHENHRLPCHGDGEQRGVLEVEVELPQERGGLWFFATHLDHRPKDEERLASAKAIGELLGPHRDRPAILAGDLNDVPGGRVLAQFGKDWRRTNDKILPTVPVAKPAQQIDYVLLRPTSRWSVVETKVLGEATASDHRPILAVLKLLPATAEK